MFEPPGQIPGSYVNLLSRMIQNVKRLKAAEQILERMQQLFEQELEREHVVLSRPERERLFRQVTQAVLKDLQEDLEGPKDSK